MLEWRAALATAQVEETILMPVEFTATVTAGDPFHTTQQCMWNYPEKVVVKQGLYRASFL